jgi:ligand-binding sensor domain-containing protein
LLEVENNSVINFYNSQNSPIGYSSPSNPKRFTTRISGADFDNQGNLWLADALSANKLKKLSAAGSWTSVDLSSLQTNETQETNILVVDRNNSVWIATRRNGVYVYNENGNRKKVLNGAPNSGSLPDVNVRAIAIDADNRAWIGTLSGLAVYSNAAGIFDDETPNANSIVINGDENGFGERLLGDQTINSIAIDGAENKWFGTDNGGVIYTNPNGQKTLANFSKRNSPLPSNKIVKIAVDEQSGKVYFATDKGIVAYNSKVAPFGENLGVVYAYPNPALKNHEKVTIDGRDGTHLPRGTNVKIIDVSGNLVYETNVVEGQQLQGGKVVWDKKNLVGNPVVSGIYIVLLSNDDASQTSVTKIAIVN